MAQHHVRLFRFVVSGAVVVVAGLVGISAELATRYYERHRTTPPDYVPSIFYRHQRLTYGLIPNLDYYGWFKINSLGFRGREFSVTKEPGIVRIVCLGGSTTWDGGSIGRDRPWPEILEATLRQRLGKHAIEVLNLGIPGATSLDSLIDLQMRGLAFEPDLLIVYQGHNDLSYSIPRLHPRPSGLFPFEDRPRSGFVRWLSLHSLLYAKGEIHLVRLWDRLTGFLPLASQESPASPEDRTRGIEKGLADYRVNLRSIAALARANGIALALPQLIIPFSPDDSESTDCRACDGLPEAYGAPVAEIRSAIERYTRVLEELGAVNGVHYIPTEGWVPSGDRYYAESVHFSPAGSARMGEKLAEALTPILSNLPAARPAGGWSDATASEDIARPVAAR